MFHRTDFGRFLASMLLNSHPTIKWRWKNFCCNWFDAKSQIDWTSVVYVEYALKFEVTSTTFSIMAKNMTLVSLLWYVFP